MGEVCQEGGAIEQHKLAGGNLPRVAGILQAADSVEEEHVLCNGGWDLQPGRHSGNSKRSGAGR